METLYPNYFSISSTQKERVGFLMKRKNTTTTILFCSDQSTGNAKMPPCKTLSSGLNLNPQKESKKGSEIIAKDSVPFGNGRLSSTAKTHDGIGIVQFFRGKKLLIAGATGFLAKVLVEKILRTIPEVDKIYLIIKAKNREAAKERLMKEIINTEVFKCLREEYGKSYEAFMLSKLVPVVGNVCESIIGFEEDLAHVIAKEVDVIVNSAANTVFDERFDVALDINTRGPSRMMSFAKKCKKLKLFVQVSTAYVNGEREGKLMEKPLERSVVKLDVESEIKFAMEMKETFKENEIAPKMKALGLQRAKKYGWQDTYVFTKSMGEMVIDDTRGEIPVVIIRPSVIESTFKEPFAGWIEGNRMMDPIILLYGKGQLPGFLLNPHGILDVVPADMVVNATLAAIAKHGNGGNEGLNHVYQIASSVANPLVLQNLTGMIFQHFNSFPCFDSKGNPIKVSEFRNATSMQDFSSQLQKAPIIQRCGSFSNMINGNNISQRMETIRRKSMEHVKYLASLYQPYTFYGGRFDNSNAEKLMKCLSEEERMEFGFDVRNIDWKDYIINVHIPGLRKNVMKERVLQQK